MQPKNNSSNNQGKNKPIFKKFNIFLTILIMVSLIILMYRLSWLPPEKEFKPKLPSSGIINIHEHIHRTSDAKKWLEAMNECEVSATVMLGSPEVTFLLNSPPGFNNYSTNNEVILWLEKKYNSKILAFPTIDPCDPKKLEILKSDLDEGAIGLKLFSGHTGEIFSGEKKTIYDYLGPLDREDMSSVYEYCERNKIPIIWHIKLQWEYLYNETKSVLSDFPNLIVNIPHFGVLGSELARLEQLMDNYSGVYTDISFGGFAYWSMQKVSNNIEVFKKFVSKYHARVMFGIDMVVTSNVRKTVSWISNLTMGYRHMLEKDEYYINVPNITGEGFDLNTRLKGLGLSQEILDEIYYENPITFLSGKPANENVSGNSRGSEIDIHIEMNILLSNSMILGTVKCFRRDS